MKLQYKRLCCIILICVCACCLVGNCVAVAVSVSHIDRRYIAIDDGNRDEIIGVLRDGTDIFDEIPSPEQMTKIERLERDDNIVFFIRYADGTNSMFFENYGDEPDAVSRYFDDYGRVEYLNSAEFRLDLVQIIVFAAAIVGLVFALGKLKLPTPPPTDDED